VVCDEKLGDQLILEYAALPEIDKLRVARVKRPIEAFLDAMMRECEGDWVLRLDSDEIPSASLLEFLSDLSTIHDHYTHAWLKCLWLWPDNGHSLDGAPWGFDRQLRLFRNVPSLWQLSSQIHSTPRVLGPGVMLKHEFFHATLLQLRLSERHQKAMAYEYLGPGIRTRQGASTNFSYYMPELSTTTPTCKPLSDVDRDTVAFVMTPSLLPDARPKMKPEILIPTGTRTQDARTDNYSGIIQLKAFGEPVVRAGYSFVIDTCLANISDSVLSLRGKQPLLLGAKWIQLKSHEVLSEARAGLPEVIPPKFEISAPIELQGPRMPGTYLLRIDLVTEGVQWHEVGVTLDVVVRDSDRSRFDEIWSSWASEACPFTPDEAYLLFASSHLLSESDSLVVESDSAHFRNCVIDLLEMGRANLIDQEGLSHLSATAKNLCGDDYPEVSEAVVLRVIDWSAESVRLEGHSLEPTPNRVTYHFSGESQDGKLPNAPNSLGSVGRISVSGDPVLFGRRLMDAGPNWNPPRNGI